MSVRRPLAVYFNALTGGGRGEGWLELRYRRPGGMRTRFYPAQGPHGALARTIARIGPTTDVYVGCALRRVQRGDRAHVSQAWVLWAECDGEDARGLLDAFAPAPSLVIGSGTPGNVHAYWALDAPADAATAEAANRQLAAAVDGDPVCFDAARILRPPGTWNHKHAPPASVQLVGTDRRESHALADIVRELPSAIDAAPRARPPRVDASDPLLEITPGQYVAALVGKPLGRDRKVSCPFHEDRTPSLHAYPTPERGWFCFGCRRGGSIYDLAAELWLTGHGHASGASLRGREFVEVRERLLAMFLGEWGREKTAKAVTLRQPLR